MKEITADEVYQVLKEYFPQKNDFNKTGYDEEL